MAVGSPHSLRECIILVVEYDARPQVLFRAVFQRSFNSGHPTLGIRGYPLFIGYAGLSNIGVYTPTQGSTEIFIN